MAFYPDQVDGRFRRSDGIGTVIEPTALGTAGAPECGAIARLTLEIGPDDRIVHDAKHRCSGCGYAVAAMSVLTESLVGLSVPDAAQLLSNGSTWDSLVIDQLGDLPVERKHCVRLALDALSATLADHRATFIETVPGEEALICTCFFVSERTIEDNIRRNGLVTIDDVTRSCRAGGGCGSCQSLIADILESIHHERLGIDHDLFG